MNVVPQDSTTPQRPNVEGLRAYSDPNGVVSGVVNDSPNTGRDSLQAYGNDTNIGRTPSISTTRPMSNPYTVPQIPPPHYQHSENTRYMVPQRIQSLTRESQQTHVDAQRRRALATLLEQRARDEENMQALRRRMSANGYMPNTSNFNHRHSASFSTAPNFSRPNFPASNSYPNRTIGHQPDSEASGEDGNRNGYAIPRWQPDAEVTNCPICDSPFTFWYRKHHCRKCGRVVCANCSPHRITIPKQYIVSAPSVHPVEIDLTGNSAQDNHAPRMAADQLSMDGGQEVRLCNPCVPDPNPLPPSQLYSRPSNTLPLSQPAYIPRILPETHLSNRRRSHHLASASENYARYHGIQSNPLTRHRSSWQPQYSPSNPNLTAPYGSVPDSSPHLARYGSARPHHRHASLSMLPTPRRTSMLEDRRPVEIPFEDSPQRQIAEEDECPICHEELPPKGPDGSETERESHVTSCIEAHFSSSRPKDGLNERPDVSATELSSTPAQTGSNLSSSSLPGPSFRRRTTGMLVYNATEKDCVGEDGTPQECIICFEDFEAGTEMGRLECLCKFHKACIRSWWDTKGVGACPVHQGGLI